MVPEKRWEVLVIGQGYWDQHQVKPVVQTKHFIRNHNKAPVTVNCEDHSSSNSMYLFCRSKVVRLEIFGVFVRYCNILDRHSLIYVKLIGPNSQNLRKTFIVQVSLY